MPDTPPPGEDPLEPLEALRIRLEETQRATERLVRETTEFASAGTGEPPRTPPRGWESATATATGDATSEIQALAGLVEALRGLLPEDIQRQVTEIVRQLLLLVRAIVDWWISRLEPGDRGRDVAVEDIPIA